MSRFHVFLKAPSFSEFQSNKEYRWETILYDKPSQPGRSSLGASSAASRISLPPATLEEASRRISRIYENIIFNDAHSDGEEEYDGEDQSNDGILDTRNSQGRQTEAIPTHCADLTPMAREHHVHYLATN